MQGKGSMNSQNINANHSSSAEAHQELESQTWNYSKSMTDYRFMKKQHINDPSYAFCYA